MPYPEQARLDLYRVLMPNPKQPEVPEEAVEAAKTAMAEHIPGCGPRPAAFSPDINSAAWAAVEAAAPSIRKQAQEQERERLREALELQLASADEIEGFDHACAALDSETDRD
jgi:hypothetical protein